MNKKPIKFNKKIRQKTEKMFVSTSKNAIIFDKKTCNSLSQTCYSESKIC